jgi:hypothetical protein
MPKMGNHASFPSKVRIHVSNDVSEVVNGLDGTEKITCKDLTRVGNVEF